MFAQSCRREKLCSQAPTPLSAKLHLDMSLPTMPISIAGDASSESLHHCQIAMTPSHLYLRQLGVVFATLLLAYTSCKASTVDQVALSTVSGGSPPAALYSGPPRPLRPGPASNPSVNNRSLVEFSQPAYVECHEDYQSCGQDFHWQLMPQGLIYQTYLASVKESRFRAVWNDEKGQGDIWDVTLGGQVGLLRYGTSGNVRPNGWQLGIEGAGLVRLDLEENSDVIATDYRFGVPLTWGDDIYQVKFAFYHLSSHVGDEFLLKNPGFPRLNYSRDVLVWGGSLYLHELWRVYSEFGYAFSSDVSEPWEMQFGIEHAPEGPTGIRGKPFAAFNAHLREEVDFGGNVVFQTGWAWRRAPATGIFRVGVEYYNGKSDQFSFFDESEQKVGFGLWYDY